MSLDLNTIEQFSQLMDRYFFYPFYEKLSQTAQESSYILSWTSPIIGLTDGIAGSIQAIGAVAEAAIKGISNLAKGGISYDIHLLEIGSKQLFLGAGVIGALSIPLVLFRTVRIAGCMMMCPKETTEIQAKFYREKVQRFTTITSAQETSLL